jgi:hypothetical protein
VAVSIGQGQAIAESAPQFSEMAIAVMPEQEQSRVSVAYRREVSVGVPLPRQAGLDSRGQAKRLG